MNQIRCSGDEHCSNSKVKKKNTKDEQKKHEPLQHLEVGLGVMVRVTLG